MKFYEVETTFVCQLGKAKNRAMLEAYKDRNDRSPGEFVRYYIAVINALATTPAWGVSGVNKMINELTASVRATISHAKNGKSSAPAHAASMLRYIDHFSYAEAEARYCGRHKLQPLLTAEELQQVLAAT
jgi:hypothetical protein